MKTVKIFGIALGVVALIAAAQPAQAACGAPFLITSINSTTGYYAYVVNPTLGGVVDPDTGSSVTPDVTGYFWGVGFGDPALGTGIDNGSFDALRWLYLYPGYPATVLTTWAATPEIDTCIDLMGPLGERCQVTFFQDVDVSGETNGAGLFAIVSTPDDPSSGDFFLDNGGVNITMAPLAQMQILGSARASTCDDNSSNAGDPCGDAADCPGGDCTGGDTGVVMEVSGPSAESIIAGSYLSDAPACQGAGGGGTDPLNGLITGYRASTQVLPRGSAPPSDFSADAWVPASDSAPLGSPVMANIPCDGDSDVYTTFQLMLESGFAAPIVSSSTTRVECGPNVADPDGIRVKPEGRRAPRTRTR